MTNEELTQRMGVERAQWKFYGGRGANGSMLKSHLGLSAWDNGWTDGIRYPLSVPGQVSEDEWARAIIMLLQRRP